MQALGLSEHGLQAWHGSHHGTCTAECGELCRSHQLAEDVLCVRVSPDGKLLAAALLDSTIQASPDVVLQGILQFSSCLLKSSSEQVRSYASEPGLHVIAVRDGSCHSADGS